MPGGDRDPERGLEIRDRARRKRAALAGAAALETRGRGCRPRETARTCRDTWRETRPPSAPRGGVRPRKRAAPKGRAPRTWKNQARFGKNRRQERASAEEKGPESRDLGSARREGPAPPRRVGGPPGQGSERRVLSQGHACGGAGPGGGGRGVEGSRTPRLGGRGSEGGPWES